MTVEFMDVDKLVLPEYEDDNLGHRYMTLWNINSRQNASFEVLAANGGLMKGRVDFDWDFTRKHQKVVPYRFYLEILEDGVRKAALFDFMYKKGQEKSSLLSYINMGKPIVVNKATDRDLYTVEFDSTTKAVEHPDEEWTNSGIVEIGMYYSPNSDWETIKLHSSGSSSTNNNIHITLDINDFRDLLICGVNDKKQLAVLHYRRDIPVLKPTDYYQSQTMGSDRLFAKMTNDSDIVVGVGGREDAYFKELYWKHIN